MKNRDFTSAKAKEAILPDKEEKCCGGCCWFYAEDTDGWGFCACQKGKELDIMNCSDMCEDDYVSKKEMRHHMAVLLQYHRADESMNYRFPGGDALEDAVVFAYRYMKVFSEL